MGMARVYSGGRFRETISDSLRYSHQKFSRARVSCALTQENSSPILAGTSGEVGRKMNAVSFLAFRSRRMISVQVTLGSLESGL
jgi:hypothetical protein